MEIQQLVTELSETQQEIALVKEQRDSELQYTIVSQDNKLQNTLNNRESEIQSLRMQLTDAGRSTDEVGTLRDTYQAQLQKVLSQTQTLESMNENQEAEL